MNENHAPLISVVIPTYNHARYLSRALQSVLDQTYTNWEAIVIDNHSTDNTAEIMAGFTDPRISYLKIHNNGVIAASRNMGIRAAEGEWIAFLDSDDWWTTDKLQVCFGSINKQVDLIYHDLRIVSNQPRFFKLKIIESWQVKSPVLIDLMERGNAIATSSVIVRTFLLKQLNGMNESPEMIAAEDYNTWLRIAQLTEKFKHIPKRLGFYQLHNQGMSRKDMSISGLHATDAFVDLLTLKQKNKFLANLQYNKGRFNYSTGNIVSAKKNLLFSLRYGRVSIKLKSAAMLIVGTITK